MDKGKEKDNNKVDSSTETSEATAAGTPPPPDENGLEAASRSRLSPKEETNNNANDTNNDMNRAPMDPAIMAMVQRYKEEKALLHARMFMQQRQADESMLASAMATASNNIRTNPPPPHLNAQMYQQALLQGRGASLPPLGAQYGGLHPLGMPPLPVNAATAADFDAPSPKAASADNNSKGKKSNPEDEEKKNASDDDESAPEAKEDPRPRKNQPYFDGSTVPDPRSDEEDSDDKEEDEIGRPLPPKSKKNEAFPAKLYRIIEEAKANGQEDIISFFPHGRAFGIHKPREFVSEIMPKYLSTVRLSSFQRQLNLYNFKRIQEGPDKGGYYHEFFLNGRKALTKKIKRKRPKVPKATRQDMETAARISSELHANGVYPTQYGNTDTLQRLMMMERGMGVPQNVGMGAAFGYGGAPIPPSAAMMMRGPMFVPQGPGMGSSMADPNGFPNGGGPPPQGAERNVEQL